MSKVLFIKSSMTINSERGSISTLALNTFKEEYKKSNPQDEIIEMDLNKEAMAQKSMTSDNFKTFFNEQDSDKYIDQLKLVDKVVLATPMTNFNYTAVLKNYLDHVLVAKKTFLYKYDGNGVAEGLLKNLKVQIITSQGAPLGWYPFGNHTETLRGTWNFMGAKVSESIIIDGTKAPANLSKTPQEMIKPFIEKLTKAAQLF